MQRRVRIKVFGRTQAFGSLPRPEAFFRFRRLPITATSGTGRSAGRLSGASSGRLCGPSRCPSLLRRGTRSPGPGATVAFARIRVAAGAGDEGGPVAGDGGRVVGEGGPVGELRSRTGTVGKVAGSYRNASAYRSGPVRLHDDRVWHPARGRSLPCVASSVGVAEEAR